VIVLSLPYPISANRYWKAITIPGRTMMAPSKEAKAYKTAVALMARAAGVREPIAGRVAIDIRLYPHRPLDWQKRMRQLGEAWDDTVQCLDLDNASKVLFDAFKGVVIVDDKWVRRITSERMEPDGEARVIVTVTALQHLAPQAELLAPDTALARRNEALMGSF
jgi:crossover junction endodeoxyribonuclease RusA